MLHLLEMTSLQNPWKAPWMALQKKKQKRSSVFWKIKQTKMRINDHLLQYNLYWGIFCPKNENFSMKKFFLVIY